MPPKSKSAGKRRAPQTAPAAPHRADARLNRAKIIAAARGEFADWGAAATLDDIARRAGVGAGTLYRNFSSRQHLIDAVYATEMMSLGELGEQLMNEPPWQALEDWLSAVLAYLSTKHALAKEMAFDRPPGSDPLDLTREKMLVAGDKLLRRAQVHGVARADVTIPDAFLALAGIAAAKWAPAEMVERSLRIVTDGMRPPSA